MLFILHLALGQRSRMRQMAYLAELVNSYPHAVVMGDLNCELTSPEMRSLVERTDLHAPPGGLNTFPSWRPRRNIDHILITPGLKVERTYLPHWTFSDHLPIAMEVLVPETVRLHN